MEDLVGEVRASVIAHENALYARTEDGLFRIFSMRGTSAPKPVPVIKFNDMLYIVIAHETAPRTKLDDVELGLVAELKRGSHSERLRAREAELRSSLPSTVQIIKKLRSELDNAPKMSQQLQDLQRSSYIDEDEFVHSSREHLSAVYCVDQTVKQSFLHLGENEAMLSDVLAEYVELPPNFSTNANSWLRSNGFKSPKHAREEDLATPLHFAAFYGEVALMLFLVQSGASTNACDIIGKTPLHYAADGLAENAVKFLLANGAQVSPMSLMGQTPLHLACFYGNRKISRLLLDKGADLEAKLPPYSTPLSVAIVKSSSDFVSWLISQGASIQNAETNYMGSAAFQACAIGHLDTLDVLVENGADVHYLHYGTFLSLMTCAAYRGQLKMMIRLMELGLPIDEAPVEGWCSPLVAAVQGGSIEVAKWLKDNRVDIHRQQYKGLNLLQVAKAAPKCPPQLVSWIETQLASKKKKR